MKIIVISATDAEAAEILSLINTVKAGEAAYRSATHSEKREEEVWIERIHAELDYPKDFNTFACGIIRAIKGREIPKEVCLKLARMSMDDPYLVTKGMTLLPLIFKSFK